MHPGISIKSYPITLELAEDVMVTHLHNQQQQQQNQQQSTNINNINCNNINSSSNINNEIDTIIFP